MIKYISISHSYLLVLGNPDARVVESGEALESRQYEIIVNETDVKEEDEE